MNYAVLLLLSALWMSQSSSVPTKVAVMGCNEAEIFPPRPAHATGAHHSPRCPEMGKLEFHDRGHADFDFFFSKHNAFSQIETQHKLTVELHKSCHITFIMLNRHSQADHGKMLFSYWELSLSGTCGSADQVIAYASMRGRNKANSGKV